MDDLMLVFLRQQHAHTDVSGSSYQSGQQKVSETPTRILELHLGGALRYETPTVDGGGWEIVERKRRVRTYRWLWELWFLVQVSHKGFWGYGAGKPLEREPPPARHLLSSSPWHGPEGPEWRLGAGPIAIDDIRYPGISLAFSLLSSPDVCEWVGCPCVVGWLEARLERDGSGWPVVETRGKRCRSTALEEGVVRMDEKEGPSTRQC